MTAPEDHHTPTDRSEFPVAADDEPAVEPDTNEDPSGDPAMTPPDYRAAADAALEDTYEPPMSLESYVDVLFARPERAANATKYLLSAIEAAGTRTVVEEGETKTRYRFFDDPHNDGEHAVLGNTAVLNDFVDDLRAIAAGRGKDEKIIWFDGPTATGKSELKRCLINGLREYSKTPEGRRYTIEWNVATGSEPGGLTYGDGAADLSEDHWYASPVQTHPLAVFPESVRDSIADALNARLEDHVPIRLESDLDPFSQEAYDYLEEQYRRRGEDALFSAVTAEDHLRVKNYVVDVGSGIGVLHAEDDGRPKERLVGSWMAGMLQELDSRGRKNPQAFSYDGALSQGNGLLTVVEDATQHADLLQRLLNVPDEGTVKLDKGIGMDVDTQLVIISNPDLEATLNQHADRAGADPLKALKRRLDRKEFAYLTNLSLEVELIRRELTDETAVWTAESYEELANRIREPVTVTVSRREPVAAGEGGAVGVEQEGKTVATDDGENLATDDGETVTDRELAPHAIEAAALYSVVTRLDEDDLPTGMDLVEKAILFDQGYLQEGDERREAEDFEFDPDAEDGAAGIPVTFTRDRLAELLTTEFDRHHPDLDVASVLMPDDVLDAMADGLATAPVFNEAERSTYEDRLVGVKRHVYSLQERDVIDALMAEKRVETGTVEEYIEHVYAWATDEAIETDRGEPADPDPLKMKVFEIEHLGRFAEDDYAGTDPTPPVRTFREEKLITAINRHAWQHRTEDFAVGDVDLAAIPVLQEVLESHDWDDVRRTFEDLEPAHWEDPPADTETERCKANTIESMIDLFGYSEASAELTSREVMAQVAYQWDDAEGDTGRDRTDPDADDVGTEGIGGA